MSVKNNWDAEGFWLGLSRTVEARGWTWKKVSEATGVSSSTLSRMKTGRRPDAASLAVLSNWSGINPAQFFRDESVPPQARFCPDTLASAIREMVKADIQGDGERYTIHETIMRQQFQAIQNQIGRDPVRFRVWRSME